jgi:hypothetical protein
MADAKLTDYVISKLRSGVPVDEIKKSLLDHGWSHAAVEEGVTAAMREEKLAGGRNVTKTDVDARKSGKTIFIVGGVIALLILLAAGYYAYSVLSSLPNLPPDGGGNQTNATCGNGICDAGETQSSCPDDCHSPPPSGPALMSIIPAQKNAGMGETFTLDVKIENAADVFGFQFDVDYDPAILEFTNAAQGGFLNNNGQENTFCVDYKNSTGLVKNVACTRMGRTSVYGSGVLEKLTFKVIGIGVSNVKLLNVKIAGSNAEKINSTVLNGEVTVS